MLGPTTNWRLIQGIYQPVAPVVAAGHPGTLRIGADSILLVNVAGGGPATAATPFYSALGHDGLVHAGACVLELVVGRFMGAAGRWLMFIDKAAALANGDTPRITSIPLESHLPAGFPTILNMAAFPFANACRWAVSSTAETLTITAANEFSISGTFRS